MKREFNYLLSRSIFPLNPRRYYEFIINRKPVIKFKSWFMQFTPFSRERGPADFPVLVNSLPKSGTHLLIEILNYLSVTKHVNVHLLDYSYEIQYSPPRDDVRVLCYIKYALRKLRKGQHVGAHITYSPIIDREIKRNGIVAFFMYRDPRDVVTSYMRFVTYSEKYAFHMKDSRKFQKFMQENFKSDEERLTYIIKNIMGPDYFMSYLKWIDCSQNVIPIRFENLYEELIRCKEDPTLGENIKMVVRKMGLNPDSIVSSDLYKNVFGKGRTFSSISKKIGQYKEYFKDEHYEIFNTKEFKEIMRRFSFEQECK